MTAPAYYCLGGPLHGQLRAEPEGVNRFTVYELQGKAPAVNTKPEPGSEQVIYTTQSYRLIDHPKLDKVWWYEPPLEASAPSTTAHRRPDPAKGAPKPAGHNPVA
ncbi:hypothetical protein D3C76_720730 [compost metagenome]